MAERPEIIIIDQDVDPFAAGALRKLADMLDADDDLCLIGLWHMPGEADNPLGYLQVVVTRERAGVPSEEPDHG